MSSLHSNERVYAMLRPDQLEACMSTPVAYVPWGALEWHSFHLPVGLDGITAEAIACRAADRSGGLVLPTMYLPITALPHRFSISFQTATVRAVLADLFRELERIGFRVVVVVSGHYAQGHELALIDAAEAAMATSGLRVLATPPMALVNDGYLDHAGRWETAQMLATYPHLVDQRALMRALEEYPAGHVADLGILGELPSLATAASGEVAIEQAVDALDSWVRQLLTSEDLEPLRQYYAERRNAYRDFIDRYLKSSYEDAAAAWWNDRVKRD
jgi:creatinine amidohydrolase